MKKRNHKKRKIRTIYGIYELSQYMGVSPWYYFADVPIKKKSGFSILKIIDVHGRPDIIPF